MNKLLISACLLGDPVRYDGQGKRLRHAGLDGLIEEGRVIGFCPEVAGGLPVPRPPAEIQVGGGDAVLAGKACVVTGNGEDVSEYFIAGARQALALCREHGIRVAVLTDRSPSCGSSLIYDGNFSRQPISGSGVTAALLRRQGIAVFSQHRLDDALRRLSTID
jgi:uncharacterized protein YbbK (DUF523 family)